MCLTGRERLRSIYDGRPMKTRMTLTRASIYLFLAIGLLTAAAESSKAQDFGKVGPPLEIMKTFGDGFRLVGIGVSAKGRVFATAPSSDVRSRFSMVEIDPKTRAIAPYPDAAWNNFSEQGDGKSEWISLQALWVDKRDHLWALELVVAQSRSGAAATEAGRVRPFDQPGDPAI